MAKRAFGKPHSFIRRRPPTNVAKAASLGKIKPRVKRLIVKESGRASDQIVRLLEEPLRKKKATEQEKRHQKNITKKEAERIQRMLNDLGQGAVYDDGKFYYTTKSGENRVRVHPADSITKLHSAREKIEKLELLERQQEVQKRQDQIDLQRELLGAKKLKEQKLYKPRGRRGRRD